MFALSITDREVFGKFCGTIRKFASDLDKTNFFLIRQLLGKNKNEDKYRKAQKSDMNTIFQSMNARIN